MRGQETAHSTFEFDDRSDEDDDGVGLGGIEGGNLNGLTLLAQRGTLAYGQGCGVINLTVAMGNLIQ